MLISENQKVLFGSRKKSAQILESQVHNKNRKRSISTEHLQKKILSSEETK